MSKDDLIKKRYVFFDPCIEQKDIELDSERVKQLMDDTIDEILKMYVPDGNPEIWRNKIIEFKKA